MNGLRYWCVGNRWNRPFVAAIFIILMIGPSQPISAQDATDAQDPDERIAALIVRLGHPQFAIRDRAQLELKSLGLAAFDALNEAVDSDQLEVALRAEYLLKSMSVQWYSEDDPPKMKQLLTDYGNQSEESRKSRLESLANMTEGDVLRALCRLARFETSARLSKAAALNAMQRQPENRQRAAASILRHLGSSKRPGAQWMRLFAKQLRDGPQVLEQWNEVIRKERRVLVSAAARTSLTLVRDLSRWQVDQLLAADKKEEAIAAIRRSLELIDGSKEQVKENSLWLMKQEAWDMVKELAERHAIYFDSLVDFKYLLAEAELGSGRSTEAERLAQEALSLKPDEHEEHIEAAVQLTDRGRHSWAANEFRTLIENNEEGSLPNLRARFLYSEMLYDGMLQPADAAEVLEPAVQAMKDQVVAQQVRLSLGRDPIFATSRMHYFRAIAQTEAKDLEAARENLDKAVALYGDKDPDVLIAMYRLPGQDAPWRRGVLQRITTSAARMKNDMAQYKNLMKRQQLGANREQFERRLATLNNQYAWLIANTEGDYSGALSASLESLEYTPGSPVYLDTLARCYFANKDYANAVKHQRLAVEQIPHSGLMQRQLKEFEAVLKKQGQ